MRDTLASIKNVRKQFPNTVLPALDHINGSISAGQICGLVGADGAGKTTLLRLLAGLLEPSEGVISIFGLDSVKGADAIHGRIGYMPQRFGLYEDLTVIENLRLYADLRGVVGDERAAAFERLLRFTDLASFTTRLAGKLSGGMKQKLGLACALIRKPRLLLLDEPSVGVDPISRRELWKMVGDLVDDGIGVVWSTAYLDEAERCDTVILLNEGKLLHHGPPSELTQRVEGRVFLVSGIAENERRQVLAQCLQQDEVLDGVIQGKNLRLLIRNGGQLHALPGKAQLTMPRFEDAFIDRLGGGPGGDSELAKRMAMISGGEGDAPVIEATNLTKKFGTFTAADDVSFEVRRGEVFGLLGPNGAGKSTAFKMMCGLLQPTSGIAMVTGLDLKTATSQARSRIGYMAQKFSLYGDLSVRQNLEFFSGIYGLNGQRKKSAIEQMVEIFGLEGYLKRSAMVLPLGFKQRLALACAVMHEPSVLFLDEPTSGVDPLTRREFWSHINGLVEKGVTIMVTTHFMDEAEYCDRIALVFRGRIIATGSPDVLKAEASANDASLEEAFIELIERETRGGRGSVMAGSVRRMRGLVRKELAQVVRDPSSVLIAFVLPGVLLFLFGYGVSLDANHVRIGVVLESTTPEAQSLAAAFKNSRYFETHIGRDRRQFEKDLVAGKLRGLVIVPATFAETLRNGDASTAVQVIADGSEPNTASFVQNYLQGVLGNWLIQQSFEVGRTDIAIPRVSTLTRVWFNPELQSRWFLLPGSIAIIMTIIGTLLTALVVAREWERGTMEALMATPISIVELLVGKLAPYYLLGMGSMLVCVLTSVSIFELPFRGSILALVVVSSIFLIAMLALGLLISTVSKNQFVASQIALVVGFLPSFLLSGFVFEISSMPLPIQTLTRIIPARYFVGSLQTIFLAGDIPSVLVPNTLTLCLIATVLMILVALKTKKRLD